MLHHLPECRAEPEIGNADLIVIDSIAILPEVERDNAIIIVLEQRHWPDLKYNPNIVFIQNEGEVVKKVMMIHRAFNNAFTMKPVPRVSMW